MLQRAKGAPKRGAEWLVGNERRWLDLAIGSAIAPVAVPVALGSAAAIRFVDQMPPLFTQDRVGRNCELFTMYKWRTMPPGTAETSSWRGGLDPRATKLGMLLRKTHADESAQLLNVFRGDMSLVGPRPIIPQEFSDMMDVLSPPMQKELRAVMRFCVPGVWSDYNNYLHHTEYSEHSLEARADDTIYYGHHASRKLYFSILNDGMMIGIGGLKDLVLEAAP